MKIVEALNLLRSIQGREGAPLSVFLAAGFTPLHLGTFLAAELAGHFPLRPVTMAEGLYGDLTGNLDRLAKAAPESGAVVIEWPDLDPRLGVRSTARFSQDGLADILSTAHARAAQIRSAVEDAARRTPLAVCMPTLPLPPLAFTPGAQASPFELELHAVAGSLSAALAAIPRVRVVNAEQLGRISPVAERHDIESELRSGFPWRTPHASAVASLLAALLGPAAPKKGLITDLDDTLWLGILGEDGIDGVSWDLEHHSQMHAWYQRFLGSLASAGVLLGVASKNDPALVAQAFEQRSDLALPPSSLFPVEAHWGPKSQSVARILAAWNIAPDAVVFIDDSPLELAEVRAAFPAMECFQFPGGDGAAIYRLTLQLRDLFGRSALLEEDAIRAQSIRQSVQARQESAGSSGADFLEQAEAEVSISFAKEPFDPRAFELVNKTNQFNLNGRRYTEGAWLSQLAAEDSFLLTASYRDKFGPLGKIAVLAGSFSAGRLTITTWVMSCRAFSRRVEHRCLFELLERFRPDTVAFDFEQTDRNGPLRDFLQYTLDAPPSPGCAGIRCDLEERLHTGLNLLQETPYG